MPGRRKKSAADDLREGVSSLYRGLCHPPSDLTFEKERMGVLAKLKLVPDSSIKEVLGETSQFDSATAGLGLFARNRGLRKDKPSAVKGGHKLEVLEKQNLRKRLSYARELNTMVRTMGDHLTNDEDIPINLWTEYDRLQRNPNYQQRTKEDLALGINGRTPGPGEYLPVKHGISSRKSSIPISFGKTERWRKDTVVGKKRSDEDDEDGFDSGRLCLSQKAGMKWGGEERQKLNELYWELGRPKRKVQVKDHLRLYAKRHQVLYKNRPAKEIIERVTYMLKYNQFKEKGEANYWAKKKKQLDVKRGAVEADDSVKLRDKERRYLETKRKLMQSPFTSTTSNVVQGPAFSFPVTNVGLDALINQSDEDKEASGEPPDISSIGVQVLSQYENKHGFTFRRSAVEGKTTLSVEEENDSLEPTATTYNPKFEAVVPRIPAAAFSDRLDDVKYTDMFSQMTGPGSYEELGSVGRQVVSTKRSAGNVKFSTEDRLKFMSSFAIA